MALIRLIAPAMAITIAIWAMNSRKKLPSAKSSRRALLCTTVATPADSRSPANIQTKACVRNALARRGSGMTPSADGVVAPTVAPGAAGRPGVSGTGRSVVYGLRYGYWS